ncbi:MAG: 3-deoxy-manno-octulosonate cytidylyltransferase [Pirellulales bacterium]|nr:3-deoxy-manno-octulosonate cytidylyltransferase [Pirellulales bacterium]
MRSYVVIPARLASTRLPNKMLLRKTGKTVLQHTYEAACRARKPLGVCVATDHELIAGEVRRFGGRVLMTSPDCASGTDRVAEAARQLTGVDIIVNVQGDEPEIEPQAIDQVIALLESDTTADMATLATPIRQRERLEDPACVKVVFNAAGRALYFSRYPIPYNRDGDDSVLDLDPPRYHQHVGIYAYRRRFLMELASLPQSPLEMTEKLEQLRVLELGKPIAINTVPSAARGIDTPADYAAFVKRRLAG